MKIAIMQPYFFPYIGYFQLLHAVDLFVIYDDVNYIKKGWINRNTLNINNKEYAFTVPLEEASQNKKINEIFLKNDAQWWSKFSKNLHQNFSKSSHFDSGYSLFQRIANYPNKRLSEFIGNSLVEVHDYLGLKKKFLYSSSLKISPELSGEKRILEICKVLNAATYINPINGESLYNAATFNKAGMNLAFINLKRESFNSFSPFISSLEIILKLGREEFNSKLTDYFLDYKNDKVIS